jgi:hypothetical protein
VGITGQLEQLDAVFNVVLVSVLVDLNVAQDSPDHSDSALPFSHVFDLFNH